MSFSHFEAIFIVVLTVSRLNSNAIPATSWLLTHLFSPSTDPTVLPRILAELRTTLRADGTVDIPTLVSLPLLNSAFHETLRLYVDILVTRQLNSDITLDKYIFRKNDSVTAPSYLSHYDAEFWNNHPMDKNASISASGVNEWYAYRFLKHDPETGKDVFSTQGTAGKFFPFGGGHQMCPGRVFARQEVLGAVALVLLNYDIEFKEYVGSNGKARGTDVKGIPRPKKQYSGSGVVSLDGDIKVRIRRRRKES